MNQQISWFLRRQDINVSGCFLQWKTQLQLALKPRKFLSHIMRYPKSLDSCIGRVKRSKESRMIYDGLFFFSCLQNAMASGCLPSWSQNDCLKQFRQTVALFTSNRRELQRESEPLHCDWTILDPLFIPRSAMVTREMSCASRIKLISIHSLERVGSVSPEMCQGQENTQTKWKFCFKRRRRHRWWISSQQYILHKYTLTGLGRNREGLRLGIRMVCMGNPNRKECTMEDGCSKSEIFSPYLWKVKQTLALIKIRKFVRVLLFVVKINNIFLS